MGTLGCVRTVLWGFFGVRRSAAAGDEPTSAQPLVLMGVAIVAAALFGLTWYGLAHLAVRSLGTWEMCLPWNLLACPSRV